MPPDHPLPCAVHLGFAGSRRLFDPMPADTAELDRLHGLVEQYLTARLRALRAELKLGEHHFLVGVSQVAAGADTLFGKACAAAGVPHRVFLTQHRADYLAAGSSSPDFTTKEKAAALALLDAPNVIEERVVSAAADRTERFEDVNVQILRASEAVLCLVRADAVGKPGGTLDLLRRAEAEGLPVLVIRVALANGEPTFAEEWHNPGVAPPELPKEVRAAPDRVPDAPLPTCADYLRVLKALGSREAKRKQGLFRNAVAYIIAADVFAAAAAAYMLAFHPDGPALVLLLAAELALLVAGFRLHQRLVNSHAARVWAVSRVAAEVARSVGALGGVHAHLRHLFRLLLPAEFRPLLRTLDVLHLRSTRGPRPDWKAVRDTYLTERVAGQAAYYRDAQTADGPWLRWCRRLFVVFSVGAMVAVVAKLLAAALDPTPAGLMAALGLLAVVLPVAAVGALSWVGALDLEARAETFHDTRTAVDRMRARIERAESAREFERLALELEAVRLGETVGWFSRRSTREAH